jgi:hypothetical protein
MKLLMLTRELPIIFESFGQVVVKDFTTPSLSTCIMHLPIASGEATGIPVQTTQDLQLK